jgi:hypothetical protein
VVAQIQQKLQELLVAQSDDTDTVPEAEAITKADLDALLEEENLIWRQRAKED